MKRLEDRYRRLLLAYPLWYRQRREEEIVATLLDAAAPSQRRPGAREAVALVVHGLAERLDLGDTGAVGQWAGAAASPGLWSAAMLSLAALVFGEALHLRQAGPRLWPFLTIGPVAYLAWIGAAIVDAISGSRWQRPAVVVAAAMTVLVLPVGDVVGPGRPPLSLLAALLAFGLPAVVRPGWIRSRTPAADIGLAVGTTVVMLAATGLGFLVGSGAGVGADGVAGGSWRFELTGTDFYRGWLGVAAAWTPAAVLGVGVLASVLVAAHRRRPAATMVGWALGWLVLSVGLAPREGTRAVSFALLGLLVAAAVVAGVVRQSRFVGVRRAAA